MTRPAPDLANLDERAPRLPDLSRQRPALVVWLRTIRVIGDPKTRAGQAVAPRRSSPARLSFIALVLVPAAIIAFYFGLLASDQFTSEARFTIREPEGDTGRASDPERRAAGSAWRDAEVVVSYIRSGAILDKLDARIDLAALFARPGADLWARLPAAATREMREVYWRGMVSAAIEHTSGIVTLKVRAFRPADASSLAEAILQASDALADNLSVRMRQDRMARADAELRRAETQVQAVFDEVTDYRNRLGLIDPVKAAADVGRLLVQVLGDRLRLERQLQVARRTNPDAPALPALDAQIAAADTQIANLRRQLAGTDKAGANLAAALVGFEEIEMRRQLAERLYTQARDAFEQARRATERRSVYMAVFVPPSLPQVSNYPARIAFSAISALSLLICWGIAVLVTASVRDHRL